MLKLIINGRTHELTANNQESLKKELLKLYPDDPEVTITDNTGKVYDVCKLGDLFNN